MESFHKGIQQIVTAKTNTTASLFKKMETVAKKRLRTLVNQLNKLSVAE